MARNFPNPETDKTGKRSMYNKDYLTLRRASIHEITI